MKSSLKCAIGEWNLHKEKTLTGENRLEKKEGACKINVSDYLRLIQ